jgi:hypothetical protein
MRIIRTDAINENESIQRLSGECYAVQHIGPNRGDFALL